MEEGRVFSDAADEKIRFGYAVSQRVGGPIDASRSLALPQQGVLF